MATIFITLLHLPILIFKCTHASSMACLSNQNFTFTSGAKIEFCLGSRPGYSQNLRRFRLSPTEVLTFPGRVSLATQTERGDFILITENNGNYEKEDLYPLRTFFIVEFAFTDVMDLPIRVHRIDCSGKICKKIDEQCALKKSFALAVDASTQLIQRSSLNPNVTSMESEQEHQNRNKFIRLTLQKLMNPGCVPPEIKKTDPRAAEIVYRATQLLGLTGNKYCQKSFLNQTQPWFVEADFPDAQESSSQMRFAAQACPSSNHPDEPTLERVRSENSMEIKTGSPTVFVVEGTGKCIDKTCRQMRDVDISRLRPIFAKNHEGWLSFEFGNYYESIYGAGQISFPSKIKIEKSSVAPPVNFQSQVEGYFDGKVIGSFKPLQLTEFGLSVEINDSPVIRKAIELFAKGWQPFAGTRVLSDREKWKKFLVPKDVEKLVKLKFTNEIKRKLKCIPPSGTSELSSLKDTGRLLNEGDVDLHARSFKSADGRYLVGAFINAPECITYRYGEPYNDVSWYYLKPNAKPQWFAHTRRSFGPKEAGDFDGDGKTEWILSDWTQDRTFYSIYSDEFRKRDGQVIVNSDDWRWWLNPN